jgi:starch-binding outer membrane protein, SusD/RagB family
MYNMKKILIHSLLVSLVLVVGSCKEFLSEEPTTFYTESSIYTTEEGVETAINGAYASLGSSQYYGTSWHNLPMVHSGKFFSTQLLNRDVTALNATPSNVWVNDLWSQAYSTINVANNLIYRLENSTTALRNKETALGQAYFIRAVAYFDLVRLFGGVPLHTTPTTLESIHEPRATRAQVLDLVIADFDKAKTMMPVPAETKPGQPSRLAANVYLAKLYMTLAGEDQGDASNWAKAKTELLPVISSGAYKLTPTYAELFMPDNENTSESIFELQYGHTGGVRNSDVPRSFMPQNSTFLPANIVVFGRIRPNKEVFDQHVNRYPGDPRISTTFISGEYLRNDGVIVKIYPVKKTTNFGFPYIKKWIDPSYNGSTTERNIIMIRYADVLLMMAEIENEISGPDQAYAYVNQVLTRARDTDGNGTPDAAQPADWSGITQSDFRIRIMQERFFELLAEGQEWFDTRRRGYQFFAQEVLDKHNQFADLDLTVEFNYPYGEKNMLLPIPLTEISGNQAIDPDDQNPGY